MSHDVELEIEQWIIKRHDKGGEAMCARVKRGMVFVGEKMNATYPRHPKMNALSRPHCLAATRKSVRDSEGGNLVLINKLAINKSPLMSPALARTPFAKSS